MTKQPSDIEESRHLYVFCLLYVSHFQIPLTRFLSFYYMYHIHGGPKVS
jgi:hypothetical protein